MNELDKHHASRLTGKVIEDNAFRTLKAWIEGMDDEAADELMDSIHAAVSDEILEVITQPEYEADMDNQVPAFRPADE